MREILMLLCCILFIAVVIGICVLAKKAVQNNLQKQIGQITADISEALRSPANRRPAGEEEMGKLKNNSVRKIAFVFIVLVVFCLFTGISEGMNQVWLEASLSLIVVFAMAFAVLFILDKKKLQSDDGDGLMVEKAYIHRAQRYKGRYTVVISYYDDKQGIIRTEVIQIDSSDVGRWLEQGEYMEIVVKTKKGKREFVAALK
ncbi:MAG: hypothetical protein NC300_05025 [Bacteroidales bacterium]|nr:hypothetical protein [Clostridium sp.]MCM1203485.1 hypothetical protein [Bacteroidales bacterium]